MRRQGVLIALAAAVVATLGGAADASAQAGVSYTVPADNPFAGEADARPEIWSYGLRNPWRFSFDRQTGDLNIADVGQDAVEEVDFVAAGAGAGRGSNFGWNCFEGSRPFDGAPAGCTAPGHVPPVLEYSSESDTARCSITGGYVVRDESLPIAGSYVYGDFCTGELRAADLASPAAQNDRSLNLVVPALSSFGEDADGRVYAASLGGPVFRFRGAGPALLLEPMGVFDMPVYVTSQPDDAERIFVVEKTGKVQLVKGAGPPVTFLDISADIATDNLERGLLSVAFAPDYATSGRFYVYYNDTNADVTIEEFRRSDSNPDAADPATRRIVLKQDHREFPNHNGGQLHFGPDGYLYAALGDGGSGGDPHGNGQSLGTILGKIIRIDPRQP